MIFVNLAYVSIGDLEN